jgi:nickel/cobalt transporter (NicO) family protein
VIEYLIQAQRAIYATISADLSAFAATRDWLALAFVLPIGIVFGAVHALTPGHGKAMLASYLVGSRVAALRASAVAAVQAFVHVGSAVLLALAAAPLVTRTLGGVGRAPALEALSRGLLIGIGLWLILRALRGRPPQHRHGFAVGVIAGLVPCPLTLFAMFFALARGVPEAGLTFALAMMLGVGLTLTLVALVSVLGRDLVTALLTRHGASIDRVGRVIEGAAGAAMIAVAASELAR